ncbi:hypothetical protein ACMWP8_29280, partial [Escherichia coli]|uniref:hypothetical protein n=1 Tax=Escherichia coli TaxID=562 RepID=UPI0039E02B3C
DPREIGRELHVGGLVEGTVQEEGDPVRIRIRLTDTKSGESKWSEDFESSQGHIFELQRAIAAKIAEKFT